MTKKKETTGLFIFRRDLRVYDNQGLISLCKQCDIVRCMFILDKRQVNPKVNDYYAHNSFLFMLQSLTELKRNISVNIQYGIAEEIVEKYMKKLSVTHLGYNLDYTPFSIKRDSAMNKAAKRLGVIVVTSEDVCLNSPNVIKPYKVFTPYYNVAVKRNVDKLQSFTKTMRKKIKMVGGKTVKIEPFIERARKGIKSCNMEEKLLMKGGESEGKKLLTAFVKTRCKKYKKRDNMTFETSRLGPHLKFGTISPRLVYEKCSDKTFRKQLYWRDFYLQIGYHFPKVFGSNFRNKIKWKNSRSLFNKWCKGETGFEIVDAAMTQLNKSGFMHNRGRMIVASFLTKLLHIDWKWGEKYFAQRLTDYDPCNNNGGWQWSAGTGVDAQPYFRIFNPYTQQEKFDPDFKYINKWLSYKDNDKVNEIIDYKKERSIALTLIK